MRVVKSATELKLKAKRDAIAAAKRLCAPAKVAYEDGAHGHDVVRGFKENGLIILHSGAVVEPDAIHRI